MHGTRGQSAGGAPHQLKLPSLKHSKEAPCWLSGPFMRSTVPENRPWDRTCQQLGKPTVEESEPHPSQVGRPACIVCAANKHACSVRRFLQRWPPACQWSRPVCTACIHTTEKAGNNIAPVKPSPTANRGSLSACGDPKESEAAQRT